MITVRSMLMTFVWKNRPCRMPVLLWRKCLPGVAGETARACLLVQVHIKRLKSRDQHYSACPIWSAVMRMLLIITLSFIWYMCKQHCE